jgi:hypothetical protein
MITLLLSKCSGRTPSIFRAFASRPELEPKARELETIVPNRLMRQCCLCDVCSPSIVLVLSTSTLTPAVWQASGAARRTLGARDTSSLTVGPVRSFFERLRVITDARSHTFSDEFSNGPSTSGQTAHILEYMEGSNARPLRFAPSTTYSKASSDRLGTSPPPQRSRARREPELPVRPIWSVAPETRRVVRVIDCSGE